MNRDTLPTPPSPIRNAPMAAPVDLEETIALPFLHVLEEWRSALLSALLRGSLIIGLVAVALGVMELLRDGLGYLAVIYGLIYLCLMAATFMNLPARLKSSVFLSIVYAFGLLTLLQSGLNGDARLFFLVVPIFAFMLLDRRVAWWSYGLIITTLVIFGFVSFAGGFNLLASTPTHTPLDYVQDAVLLGLFSWILMASLIRYQEILQRAFDREQQLWTEQRTLKQQVMERNRALQDTFQVSEKLASLQDPDVLVVSITEDIQQAFNYYHIQVYLLEKDSGDLVLMGGSGEAGRALISRRHRVPAGRGLVGRAAHTRQPVLIPDTASDPGWLPNPLLPETRSEMALPIIVGEQLLGVLDVQQNKVDGLNQQDAELMLWVARQLGVALQNAHQYVAAQRLAGREARANQILQRLQSATTVEDLLQVTVRELGTVLTADRAQIGLDLKRSKQ